MDQETIVITRKKGPDGKWIEVEEKLNAEGAGAFICTKLVLQSEDGSKRMDMTLRNDGVVIYTDTDGNEHPILVVGISTQDGEETVTDSKTAEVVFEVPFEKKPVVTMTVDDDENLPKMQMSVTPTGFTVTFKQKWTGVFQWQASERK